MPPVKRKVTYVDISQTNNWIGEISITPVCKNFNFMFTFALML